MIGGGGGGLKHVVERHADDKGIDVRRVRHDRLKVSHGSEALELSEFNARRILAALSMILDLPLTKAAQKEIKL